MKNKTAASDLFEAAVNNLVLFHASKAVLQIQFTFRAAVETDACCRFTFLFGQNHKYLHMLEIHIHVCSQRIGNTNCFKPLLTVTNKSDQSFLLLSSYYLSSFIVTMTFL